MLDRIFLQILNMSFTAGIIILFVLAVRLFLRKAPAIYSYILWSVVLFRLLCPISFESVWSLLPVNPAPISSDILYSTTPQVYTGIPMLNRSVNSWLPPAAPAASVNPLQIWTLIGEILWIAGIIAFLLYSLLSLLRLRSKLVGAVKLQDRVYLADHIGSPFVLGVVRPKIYLPSTLSENERGYILQHERTHIRRLDHVVKLLAFAALILHWFNPLVWAAFILCGKDMEMACDESVMNRMGQDMRQAYSASLLSLATGRKIIAGTPLAFGEGDTKARIRNVLSYKRPDVWVTVLSLLLVLVFLAGFTANPTGYRQQRLPSDYRVSEILYEDLIYSFGYTLDTAPQYRIADGGELWERQRRPDAEWEQKGALALYEFSSAEFRSMFPPPAWRGASGLSVRAAHKLTLPGDLKRFYLVLELYRGDPLLAIGYEGDSLSDARIRWLFQLARDS